MKPAFFFYLFFTIFGYSNYTPMIHSRVLMTWIINDGRFTKLVVVLTIFPHSILSFIFKFFFFFVSIGGIHQDFSYIKDIMIYHIFYILLFYILLFQINYNRTSSILCWFINHSCYIRIY